MAINPANQKLKGSQQEQRGQLDESKLHEIEERATYAAHLIQKGLLDEALPIMLNVIALQPNNAAWHYNLGNLHYRAQRYEAAMHAYLAALGIEPMNYSAWFNLAKSMQQLGQQEGAITSIETALRLNPNSEEALIMKATVCDCVGRQGEVINCLTHLKKMRGLTPNQQLTLGNAHQSMGNFEQALKEFQLIHGENLHEEVIHNNIGNAYLGMHHYEEAILSYEKALLINPDYLEARSNLAQLWSKKHDFKKAEQAFLEVLASNPDHVETQWNLASLYLIQGNFEKGLPLYESRWRHPQLGIIKRFTDENLWTGKQNVRDRRFLIWDEQGIGDKIQMMRYARLLQECGAKVILEVPEVLIELAKTMHEEINVVLTGTYVEYDLHCPYMSLPLAFGTSIEKIPTFERYLSTPENYLNYWKNKNQKINDSSKLKIGITWAGAKRHTNDHNRSIKLEALLPIFNVKNILFVSLQKEYRESDCALLTGELSHVINFAKQLNNYCDTAALIDQMDLIISVDTSVAHLASAMGKPVWLLLPQDPDYRWLYKGDKSPWYPSMKLYRQKIPGQWNDQIEKITSELDILAKEDVRENVDKQALLHQGQAALQNQDYQQCVDLLTRARAEGMNSSALLNDLGNALQCLGRLEDAKVAYLEALKLNPKLGMAYSNLGSLYLNAKEYLNAQKYLLQAIKYAKNVPQVHYNLGSAYYESKNYENALNNFNNALKLKRDYFLAHVYRGNALMSLDRDEEALHAFNEAIKIQPMHAESHYNRGITLQRLSKYKLAIESLTVATKLKTNFHKAKWNLALLLLLNGDYESGLPLYEERWNKDDFERRRNYRQPLWLGKSDIRGKHLFVHSEQGLGDSIQMLRMGPILNACGIKVTWEIPTALMSLVESSNLKINIVPSGCEPKSFDYHCPIMSLPFALGIRLENIPASNSYLNVSIEKENEWVNKVSHKSKNNSLIKIGIAWSGAAGHGNDRNRSMSLKQLKMLWELKNIEIYSLQKEYRTTDKCDIKKTIIIDSSDEISDFSDTAGLIMQMDYVVSVDTSVAHLAAALGKKVYLLLPKDPDFRWLLEREDSPWYPTIKIIRQSQARNWGDCVKILAKHISNEK